MRRHLVNSLERMKALAATAGVKGDPSANAEISERAGVTLLPGEACSPSAVLASLEMRYGSCVIKKEFVNLIYELEFCNKI